eukprot:6210976-Pleurochrysis_carterae.AAC.1
MAKSGVGHGDAPFSENGSQQHLPNIRFHFNTNESRISGNGQLAYDELTTRGAQRRINRVAGTPQRGGQTTAVALPADASRQRHENAGASK